MRIADESRDGCTIARVLGRIIQDEGARLLDAPCIQKSEGGLVLDLGQVDFVDSSGIQALVRVVTHCRQSDRKVAFASPQPLVWRVLQLTEISKLVPVVEKLEQALAVVGATPSQA